MPAYGRRRAVAAACGLAAALGLAAPSFAGSATTPLGVSLTINAGCTVLAPSSAAAMAKLVNPADVNCTSRVPYSVMRYGVLDIAPGAKGVVLTVIY